MAIRESHERRIIAAFIKDRNAYDSVQSDINIEEDFGEVGRVVVGQIVEYYTNDGCAEWVDRQYLIDRCAAVSPRHAELLRGVISNLEDVSAPNAVAEYSSLKLQRAQEQLVAAIADNDRQKIETYLQRAQYLIERSGGYDNKGEFVGTDISDIIKSYDADNLIRIHPLVVNEELGGGVVPGTQIAIYAPTEVGKSMLAITMTCGFLMDGRKVLYIGNEDPAKAMLLRIYSNLSLMDKDAIIRNPDVARQRAFERGYGNLVFVEASPGSMFEINKLVDKHNPAVIIVDQMANMDTRGNFTKVEKNEHLASRLRSLAKTKELVSVIVHQASDSAYGKAVLAKNDMYYSNVGVQGQMDLMIGIGMTDEMHQLNRRTLCLTKNKISSKHSVLPVKVNPLLSMVSGLE
jgi:archaellum biogenesis ATPase FlaH